MVILDSSIVAVALPVIGADLQASGPELAWAVMPNLVPLGGLLMLAGRLGDLLGRGGSGRRVRTLRPPFAPARRARLVQ
jgi:MFS family permease